MKRMNTTKTLEIMSTVERNEHVEEEEKKSCKEDTLLYNMNCTITIEQQQQQQQQQQEQAKSMKNSTTMMNETASHFIPNSTSTTTTTTDTVKTNIIDTNTNTNLNTNLNTSTSIVTKYIVNTLLSIFVWIGMILVPILLSTQSSPLYYKTIFPSEWYDEFEFGTTETSSSFASSSPILANMTTNLVTNSTNSTNDNIIIKQQQQQRQQQQQQYNRPKLLGLFLGIFAVGIGQVCTWIFIYLYTQILITITKPISVQTKGITHYNYWSGLLIHISQPEGFILLTLYLSITWIYTLMPIQYYNFMGTIQYKQLLYCLILQDCIQYCMHRLEHNFPTLLYKISHKPHHKFINPIVFNSFNGSIIDTICMILIPLYITTTFVIVNCNVWTYMAFGSIYANWLTLIHCEYILPWDIVLFSNIKFGTSSDHHVHHKYYKYNYGHLFMYWDIMCGTYRNPISFGTSSFNISSIIGTTGSNGKCNTNSNINTNIEKHNKIE